MNGRTLTLLLLLLTSPATAVERSVVPAKSEIGFTVTQMGVGVSGIFKDFIATIFLDPVKPENSTAEIIVNIASISTGEPDADTEARAKAWLDAISFPKATFKSNAVRVLDDGRYEVTGLLSLKGKPREMTVPFTLKTQADGTQIVSGEFTLQRTDFGIGGGEWNEGDLVSNKVPVHFKLALTAQR